MNRIILISVWQKIVSLVKKVNWKKVRDYTINVVVGLLFMYAFAGTTYGLYEAHQNNNLSSQIIQLNNRHHDQQVTANKKQLAQGAALKKVDAELGQFAEYIVVSNLANCDSIKTIAATFRITVPSCPALPKFQPLP